MLNAAQQQGFEALRQGMAPSANQQAALYSLWEKAPGYVPAHRGGWGEVPAAPAADAADGFRSGPWRWARRRMQARPRSGGRF